MAKRAWYWLLICIAMVLIACSSSNNALDRDTPSDSDLAEDGSFDEGEFRPMEEEGGGRGFRKDEDGNVLFSMKIRELAEWIEKGKTLSEYQIRLRFVVRDANGNEYYAYPVITLPIHVQQEKEFSVLLQGEGVDCGFCPTVARSYNVEVILVKGERELLAGMWNRIYGSLELSDSTFYRPTAIPTEEERAKLSFTVQYLSGEGGTVIGKGEQQLVCGGTAESVTAKPEQGYLFRCWSDGVKTPERSGDVIVYDQTLYALFTKDELDPGIPNLYIDTEDRATIRSKVYYVKASVTLTGAGKSSFNFSSLGASIRCRGNSSYNSVASQFNYNSKNSYRLKMDEKINLLGVGNSVNRDWVLHSNKFDASNLRNYFVWSLARQLGGFSFVPSCAWVNLYVNGDYRGVYMISEQVEVADGRIEIDDSGTEPDKGYLVELDMRGQAETGVVEGLDYFYLPGFYDQGIKNLREWVIKSEVTTTVENAFIRDYFIRCHAAIMKGNEKEIDALVDIDSMVDMFIVQELSKDVDGGGASIYWQKEKGGKLAFTAPWDYDFGLGSYGIAIKTTDFVCEVDNTGNKPNLWLQSLLKQDWFLRRLHRRMQEADEMVTLCIRLVRMQGEVLTPAADRNDRRWNIYGNHFQYYLHSQVSTKLNSYAEHIDFLCEWIKTRWEWMKNEIDSRVNA